MPIRGKKCWINIAHGVRNTAAGLRYVLYVFGTDLNDPSKVIAEPSRCIPGSAWKRESRRRFQRCIYKRRDCA